jgi:hypothetical protein
VFLDIIHRPVLFFKTQRFGDWILSPSSVDWVQLNRFLPEDEEKIQFLKYCVLNRKWTMDDVQKHNNFISILLSQEGYVSGSGYCFE